MAPLVVPPSARGTLLSVAARSIGSSVQASNCCGFAVAEAGPERGTPGSAATFGEAVVYRLLREVADGFWNGVDYLWFCRWMP